jgi:chemotaxis protein CheD
MAVASPVLVGMADIQILKATGSFSCLGLGSCIGLCLFDPTSQIGGMAHVMLPEAFPDRPGDKLGKFADTAVPELLAQLEKAGANPMRLVCAIAGGAQVFKFGAEGTNRLEIGRRNTEAVLAHLKKRGITPKAQDVGGSLGRTMTMTMETGIVAVRTVTQGEKTLCNLRA